MSIEDFDIVISGGGIAGLTAALGFGRAGLRTLCIDPTPPVTTEDASGADLRTTAFLQPSQRLLARIGLWPRLAPHAAPLSTMRIVDAGGVTATPREIADFRAEDLSDLPFAWNLPNWLIRREVLAAIASTETVMFRSGIAATRLFTRDRDARLTLSDGSQARARLIVAADGRNSTIRAELGIDVTTWRYGQKALVFTVGHDTPHEDISTEVHRTGGPFTLVPLPDLDGQHRSSVVWMDKGASVVTLAGMAEDRFNAAATERSGGILGELRLLGQRSVWPIISQRARQLVGQRTALMAEAAHVVPPIGAQGLNMSLADLAMLLDLAEATPADLGSVRMLARYQQRRLPDITARVTGIDALNRASIASAPVLRDMRRAGLKLFHDVAPLRKTLMRAGLGA